MKSMLFLNKRTLAIAPLKACIFLLFFLSAGTLQLLRDGGAVPELFVSEVKEYSGPLNYVLPLWLIVSIVVAAATALRFKVLFNIYKSELFVFLVVFYACLTLLWSDFPYNTARAVSFLMVSFFLLFVAVRVFSLDEFRRFFLSLLLCMQLVTIIFVFFLPTYGISVAEHEGKWQGIFGHKNALGNFSAMAYCIFLGDMCRQRSFKALLGALLSLVITFNTLSYTGVAVIPVATAVYVLFSMRFNFRSLLWLRSILILFIAASCVALVFISISGVALEVFGKNTSFSNRNIIWANYLEHALERPIFGYGFEQLGIHAKTHYEEYRAKMGFVVGSAHNGFIENFFWFGTVGVFLVALLLLRFIRFNQVGWVVVMNALFLISLILTNTFESRLVGFNIHFVSFMYLYFLNCSMSVEAARVVYE